MNVAPLIAKAAKLAKSYAEGNMNAAVRITRPTDPVFNRTTGFLAEPTEALIYSGKARITTLSGPVQLSVGDDPQFYSSCYVSIPLASTPQVDDIVQITAHPDTAIVGRFFRIEDVEGGSEMPVVRRMRCMGVQHSRKQVYTAPGSL